MKASLFRVNSVPGHQSMISDSPNLRPSRPNLDPSVFSSSKIAARISLRRANGRREGGSGSRGSVPRASLEDDVIARQSAPGHSPSRRAAGYGKRNEIGDYYREMLESSPNCSLLLRNYAKYLHEVERNAKRAEEYYARAILASPGDGDVLSLYGRLVWEAERDGDRAGLYFDRAVNVVLMIARCWGRTRTFCGKQGKRMKKRFDGLSSSITGHGSNVATEVGISSSFQ